MYSSSANQNGSRNIICELLCTDMVRNISFLLGVCPDYVTFLLDLLFGTVSHCLVSSILRCHVDCSRLLSNVFLDILVVASVLYTL